MSKFTQQEPVDLTKPEYEGPYLRGYKTLELTVDSSFVTSEVEIEKIYLNGVAYVKEESE